MTAQTLLPEDIDHVEGCALPRANMLLFGHDKAESDFRAAFDGGTLPHAWLIGGSEGVGKATLAFRLARHVLASGAEKGRREAIVQAIGKLAHPDLALIRRRVNEKSGEIRSSIRVEDVREAMRRVSSTSGAGGWRVVIVDSADDLNEHCANALLKTIEEPPPRALFLILAHRPAAVKSTIRSRCRRLLLSPLSEAGTVQAIRANRPDLDEELARRAALAAEGAPGAGLRLIARNWLDFIDDMERLLFSPRTQMRELAAFAEKLDGKGKEDLFAFFRAMLAAFLAKRAGQLAQDRSGLADAAALAAHAQRIDAVLAQSFEYNLQRRHMILSSLETLRRQFPLVLVPQAHA